MFGEADHTYVLANHPLVEFSVLPVPQASVVKRVQKMTRVCKFTIASSTKEESAENGAHAHANVDIR